MRSRFFPNISEDNLFNRIDLVLREHHQLLSLDMDLRMLIHVSNAVDNRVKKRINAS